MDELFHVSERKSNNRDRTSRWTDNVPGNGLHHRRQPCGALGRRHRCGRALACATCLGAGIMTICMGIFANRPLACASGFGHQRHDRGHRHHHVRRRLAWAMSVIFLEGIVILLLVLCGLREAIMDAIPVVLRHAISVGLGLFIAMIGLCDAGIITAGVVRSSAWATSPPPPLSSASSPSS